MKQRFFVTVRAPDGLLLVNKMLCDCATEKHATFAAKVVAVRQINSWDSLVTMLRFIHNLQVTVERGN